MGEMVFSQLGVVIKPTDEKVNRTLATLLEYLQARNVPVLLDAETTADVATAPDLPRVHRQELRARCDLIVVIGGDGTFLGAARDLVADSVSLLGVNLGRLGFLADITPKEMTERLDEILGGELCSEQRGLLRAQVYRDGVCFQSAIALNEVSLHKWNIARLIEFTLYVDGKLVNSQRSDGLIVSTPTGSTAYALSGGGPLLHPKLNAMVLVPICPHTLSLRPLVLGGDSRVEIEIPAGGKSEAHITCDGHSAISIKPGDQIVINKHVQALNLVHPVGHDYYATLRTKLHWGREF